MPSGVAWMGCLLSMTLGRADCCTHRSFSSANPLASQPIAKDFPALTQSFFCRPAEVVGPELIGCLLVKRQENRSFLWGVIVETEAYSQQEPACHGYRRRSASNETLFGQPGRFYVYVSYGIHHCVNVVTGRSDWANGVLLRAVAIPGEPERVAAGPGLLSRRFEISRRHDNSSACGENEHWLALRPSVLNIPELVTTTRIGISQAQDLPWRWYLKDSRSVSRRARGDRMPPMGQAFIPTLECKR